ncbi:MAG: hypothetical protein KCHDKBKB_02166 [Elusimicrobia bacterium]|nr:hypothetical protein [Elusimicrobiota bacterium]
MPLDKSHTYVFRMGSDNQIRLFWDGSFWQYEFLAGGVLFDQLTCHDENELEGAVTVHGLTLEKFSIDHDQASAEYSEKIKTKLAQLTANNIHPCPKHGLISKNSDGSCEACLNIDYPDDHKGTEG